MAEGVVIIAVELLYGTAMDKPLRVGIIGLSTERGWATAAHIPALHALSDDFELAGVANTSLASARAAAAAFGAPSLREYS
jgi:predicted dehydrogenase